MGSRDQDKSTIVTLLVTTRDNLIDWLEIAWNINAGGVLAHGRELCPPTIIIIIQ
jgi:hypothetical protein